MYYILANILVHLGKHITITVLRLAAYFILHFWQRSAFLKSGASCIYVSNYINWYTEKYTN